MVSFEITYSFRLPDNRHVSIGLHLDGKTLDLLNAVPEELPSWARLAFHQCPNCPLTIEDNSHCPTAVHFVKPLETFEDVLSYDEVRVDIITTQRVISRETSAQQGASSLMGLIMATGGCPHTSFFRPMARFHLPFADSQETVYRTASMYLLAQYLRQRKGQKAELELEGLKKIYSDVQIVNQAMADRLRAIGGKDVALNSLVILDSISRIVPLVIEASLEEIGYLFASFFEAY